jgi:hypothetical protein
VVKATCTCSESTTEAVVFSPLAVIAAIAPKVCPEEPVWVSSTQVCARLPMLPDAAAVGLRPLHRCRSAISAVFGAAPVTSTTSSSLPAGTQARMVIPPPDSSSTPS